MNICIVSHRFQKGDGQGRVNYEVVKAAINQGHHVTLLASEVTPELAEHQGITWIPINVKNYPTELLRNIIFAQKSGNWLKKYRDQFDVIKVNGAITNVPSDVNAVHFVHSSWWRSPVHIYRHRQDFYGLYQWLFTAANSYWEKTAFHQAKIIIAVSEKVAQELVNIGIPRQKIRVIVNGVDLEEFTPGVTARNLFALPENVTLALFAGDIRTPRKNLDTILQALKKVPNLHLAVVGNTQGSPFLELANNLGIRERVHFLGYRRDIAKIMQTADFFVFPSRYEACTLVLLEALASGLPVITATATGGAELITSEAGIVLSETDNIDTLAASLSILASDRSLRQQMGQIARTIAEQHSWSKMAQNYLDIFEELIINEKHSSHPHLSSSSRLNPLSKSPATAN